jgi:uncharacterized repeat protein (TIGR03803 family)
MELGAVFEAALPARRFAADVSISLEVNMCKWETFSQSACAWRAATVVALLVLTLVVGTARAQAQSFRVIHVFSGQDDGATPLAGLTVDAAGKFYGTTSGTGDSTNGSVFKLASAGSGWVVTPLNDFHQGGGGARPETKAVIGPAGNLFGVTYLGGQGDCVGNGSCGVVYELQPPPNVCPSFLCPWRQIVLYRFNDIPAAGVPESAVVFDGAGNLYGTTAYGGTGVCINSIGLNYGCGAVYKLTPSGGGWTETVIYSFQGGNDGQMPAGGLIFDAAGNLYGTTAIGGSSSAGTIFELSPSGSGWTETILHTFHVSDGSFPTGNLIADEFGNLYGAAEGGGANNGGTVFELSQPGSWTYDLLYSFPRNSGASGTLVFDSAGNLYGTTYSGGAYGYGTAYKLTLSNGSWMETDLHDFQGSDGAYPNGGLVFDSVGNLYGTAAEGGPSNEFCYGGCGTIWEITP